MTLIYIGFLQHNSPLLSSPDIYLNPQERRRLSKLSDKGRINRFLAGRLLARSICADAAEIVIPEVQISIGENGRPNFEYPTSYYLSISHSSDLSVCAVSVDPLGIDLEKRIPERKIGSIAEAVFYSSEAILLLEETDEDAQLRKFYQYWTLKEAYIKALGKSIWDVGSIPPVESVTNAVDQVIDACCYEIPGDYTLSLFSLGDISRRKVEVSDDFKLEGLKRLDGFLAGKFQFKSDITGGRT